MYLNQSLVLNSFMVTIIMIPICRLTRELLQLRRHRNYQ
jgi:hypothetical protein